MLNADLDYDAVFAKIEAGIWVRYFQFANVTEVLGRSHMHLPFLLNVRVDSLERAV
jgi:hypothetical protein